MDMNVEGAERGRRLQLTRASQWFAGNQGDPYGLVLRASADDPLPHEERVRGSGPLLHSTLLDTWVTGSRRTAEAAAADPALTALLPGGAVEQPSAAAGTALSPDRARLLADELLPKGPHTVFDLVPFARRLAARMVGVWLDVPEPVLPAFEAALIGCRHSLDALWCPQTLADDRLRSASEEELETILAGTAGVAEPVDAVRSLAVAAAEPTTVLLCGAVAELLVRPAQWKALAADPRLSAAAVLETLLWAPPVRLDGWEVREPTRIAGRELPVGARVAVLVAAADRDADDLPSGGFDIERRARSAGPGSVGGYAGAHPAGPFVRGAVEAALVTLARRLPASAPAGTPVRRRRSPALRAFGELLVAPDGG